MSDQRYVIELQGEPAGLVVSERRGFRFYAAASDYFRLDGRVFRSPAHAEQACRSILADAGHAVDQTSFIPEGGLPYGFPFTPQ